MIRRLIASLSVLAICGLLGACADRPAAQPPLPAPSPISEAAPAPAPISVVGKPVFHPTMSAKLGAVLAPKATGNILGDLQTWLTNFLAYENGTDLPTASKDAHAQGDVVAYTCYDGLTANVAPLANQLVGLLQVPGGGGPIISVGPATTFQHLRDIKNEIGPLTGQAAGLVQKIRVQLNLSCAALYIDTNAAVVDPIGLFSGTANGS